ncbi:MAG: hypothetical protein J5I94_03505 [Phaeodactylibacter sp.]|nr:hypothetical protein [Phaeodactylibacter sp.]
MKQLPVILLVVSLPACRAPEAAKIHPQNPSPMVEYTRPHYRVPLDSVPDAGLTVDLPGGFQGQLYVPEKWRNARRARLAIHFHGDSRVAQYAIDQQPEPWVLFHCHWGSGSSAYRRPVEEIGAGAFLDKVLSAVKETMPEMQIGSVCLSGWSAGYGAVRSLVRDAEAAGRIDGILLLDGLHCSYVPEGKVMAEGGMIDSTQMAPFLDWAKLAAAGEKSFLITHSSVFPGAYASTTETAEYLLQTLGIGRQPRLAEGPMGMQQTSVAGRGKFRVISFAGNSAPDHIDHYHGMWAFLEECFAKK